MRERSAFAAVMVVILAGALAADALAARGRGGHAGGKRAGAKHSGPAGGARMAAGGSTSSTRMATSSPAGGTRGTAVQAGAVHGGGRTAIAHAGGGLFALGAYHRADGRFFGRPPQRTGTLVGLAALWQVPPPDYPPPAVVVPFIPSEYIEMGPDQPVVVPPQGYWYYCPDESGYYPYVDDCPGGWELVAPPGGVPTG